MKTDSLIVKGLIDRSSTYRVLSLGFQYPSKELSAALIEEVDRAVGEKGVSRVICRQMKRIAKAFEESVKEHSTSGLQATYMSLFDMPGESTCSLYELVYTSPPTFAMARELADIAGFYRAFGLQTEDNGERPDHISVELEFMHILTLKEIKASLKGWDEKQVICIDAQKRFMEDHLGRWAPTLCGALQESAEVGFYRELAKATISHIGREISLLKVKPKTVSGKTTLQAAPLEPGCSLGACELS